MKIQITTLLLSLAITACSLPLETVNRNDSSDALMQDMIKQVSADRLKVDIETLVSFGTRNTNSLQDHPTRGIGAARDWIFDEFSRISSQCGDCLKVEKQTYLQAKARRVPKDIPVTNVIATLVGSSDPSRIYLVSGHYDSMCGDSSDAECDAPGANDDGSGTAAVIEMTRVMSQHSFDATLMFVAVAGEEQGLLGSSHLAEEAVNNKLDIHGMFTNDIIGGATAFKNATDRNTVRVFAEGVPSSESEEQAKQRRRVGGENDSPSRQLGRYVWEVAQQVSPQFDVKLIYRRDRYLRGGDHIPFLENGFPAVRFTETHEDYTHQHQNVRVEDGVHYGDTIDYIDPDYIASVTRINIATLASLASAPATPNDVRIDTSHLTNDTVLRWAANTDKDLAGYEIVWRDTVSPYWTDSKSVGNVITYTLKDMSKDNYFFGVRAIDKSGYKSPVVFPAPWSDTK